MAEFLILQHFGELASTCNDHIPRAQRLFFHSIKISSGAPAEKNLCAMLRHRSIVVYSEMINAKFFASWNQYRFFLIEKCAINEVRIRRWVGKYSTRDMCMWNFFYYSDTKSSPSLNFFFV